MQGNVVEQVQKDPVETPQRFSALSLHIDILL